MQTEFFTGLCNQNLEGRMETMDEPSNRQRGAYARSSAADPYKLLALSVITQAVQDARRGSKSARLWLVKDASFWLAGCGVDIDQDHWRAWVLAGCPRQQKGGGARLAYRHHG